MPLARDNCLFLANLSVRRQAQRTQESTGDAADSLSVASQSQSALSAVSVHSQSVCTLPSDRAGGGGLVKVAVGKGVIWSAVSDTLTA